MKKETILELMTKEAMHLIHKFAEEGKYLQSEDAKGNSQNVMAWSLRVTLEIASDLERIYQKGFDDGFVKGSKVNIN